MGDTKKKKEKEGEESGVKLDNNNNLVVVHVVHICLLGILQLSHVATDERS